MDKTKQIQIYIDKNFFNVIPRPTPEQRQALKESIREEGQHEPIIIDSSGKIIDGHTRFEICKELKIIPKYIIKNFNSEESYKYAKTVNLKRRHLNDFQIFELMKPEFKKMQEQTEIDRRKRISDIRKGKEVPMIKREYGRSKTLQELHEITGVKLATLEQCKQIDDHADDKLLESVRSGTITPRDAFHIVKKKEYAKYNKPKFNRSKLGIVIDILISINDGAKNKISILSRKANLSHYAMKEYLDLLMKSDLIEIKKEFKKYRGRPNQEKYTSQWYELKENGHLFLKKCFELYGMLPREISLEILSDNPYKKSIITENDKGD